MCINFTAETFGAVSMMVDWARVKNLLARVRPLRRNMVNKYLKIY